MTADGPSVLEIDDLRVHFASHAGLIGRFLGRTAGTVKAVDGVSIRVRKGEVLGVIGESGSGKSTLGRAVVRLAKPTNGTIHLDGDDITRTTERAFRRSRRKVQMVFQDPHAALNPTMTISAGIEHGLKIHEPRLTHDQRHERVLEAMERVGLTPVAQFADKYPGELSGGQKQRAVIARAIIVRPDLIIADEPVSMLDMSVRSKILQLLLDLQAELDLTIVYITHDLASAKLLCDRVAIMYLGRIVEVGSVEEIFRRPRHPYTRALLSAIPDPDPERSTPRDLPRGEIPDATVPPAGCAFHPRCPAATAACGWEPRDLVAALDLYEASIDAGQRRSDDDVLDLDAVKPDPGAALVLTAGRDRTSADVHDLIERARTATPGDPIWAGISEIDTGATTVTVTFHPGTEPRLAPDGDVDVACVLYPSDSPANGGIPHDAV